MKMQSDESAAISQPAPSELVMSGFWTAFGLHGMSGLINAVQVSSGKAVIADGSDIRALDTAGAWLLQKLLQRLREQGAVVTLQGLQPKFLRLLKAVADEATALSKAPVRTPSPQPSVLARVSRTIDGVSEHIIAPLGFVGESAVALL